MPKKGDNVIAFDNKKKLAAPFRVSADLEALLLKMLQEN